MIRFGLATKALIAVSLIVLLQVVVFAILFTLHNEHREYTERSRRSLAVSQLIPPIVCDMIVLRDLTLKETQSDLLSPDLQKWLDRLKEEQRGLSAELGKGKQEHKQMADELGSAFHQMFETVEAKIAIAKSGQFPDAKHEDQFWQSFLEPERTAMASVSNLTGVFDEERAAVKDLLDRQIEKRATSMLVMQVTIVMELLVIVLIFVFFKADLAGRLGAIMNNLERLANRTPLSKPIAGSDELAAIDSLLHKIDQTLSNATRDERSLIQNSQDLIVQLDCDAQILSLNPASKALLGYREEQLIDRSIDRIVHVDDIPKLRHALTELSERGQSSFELRLRTREGRTKESQWFAQRPGLERSYFCVVHDVSIEKQVDRLRHNVLQMVSHDLKSPLLAISSFFEMLNMSMLGEMTAETRGEVKLAFKEAFKVQRLVNALLDIEKIDAGMMETAFAKTSIALIFESALESVHDEAVGRGIEIETMETKTLVNADLQLIARALSCLLLCSISGSSPNSSIILAEEQTPDGLQLSVSSSSLNVPEHEMPRLFERFGNFATLQGWGMNLALCQAIIDLHKGSSGAEVRENGGCTLFFQIPN